MLTKNLRQALRWMQHAGENDRVPLYHEKEGLLPVGALMAAIDAGWIDNSNLFKYLITDAGRAALKENE